MRKIFLLLFLYFTTFFTSFALDKPNIISREEWGANDSYMDKNSEEWKKIFEKREKYNSKPKTESQIKAEQKSKDRIKKINQILLNDFKYDNEIISTEKFYNGKELVWPIEKSKKIRAIVVHHTHSKFNDSYEGIRSIYKYHSLTNGWGDLGYNFVIGKNGEIFEGRAGGETSVGAHALWNNRQTIGISLMGNYDKEPISKKQYDSLEKLINYLVKKYNIDLNKKQAFHKNCNKKDCVNPIETTYDYAIIGHRDASHTNCPGDELYKQIIEIRENLIYGKKTFSYKNKSYYFSFFDKVGEKKLLEAMLKIEKLLEKKYDEKIFEIKKYIIKYFEEKDLFQKTDITNKKIKIKLSYPENNDFITISDGFKEYKIEKIDQKLYVDGEEMENFSIKNSKNPYVEITSWDRTPAWDKEKKYKDNKFRGEIFVYLKDNNFVIVNILDIEDYLKGLGEISNSENKTKSETIIISARTYALWYVNKDRKFPGEFYDGSDDPDVFQKYLGYDLELRSPNINKVVEDTKGVVLKYNSAIIKPWYFSSSSGKTISFYDYCLKNKNSKDFCNRESSKYPFLKSKDDLGGIGKNQSGHGVGLSGTGATYFSSKGWTSSMILKYFYEGISL